MQEKKRSWGNVLLCAAFLLLCCGLPSAGILFAAAGTQPGGIGEENRTLAELPKPEGLSDLADIPEEFDAWYSDHLFLKENFVQMKSELEAAVFHELDSEKVILGTRKPWLFHSSNDGQPLETYKRTNRFTEEELREITENIDTLRSELNDAGMHFVLMIAPDKEQIYGSEYMPERIGVCPGPTRTEQLIDWLGEQAPEVCVVYPKKALETARQSMTEVDSLYYESDTHWNQAGAWIGAQELLQAVAAQVNADWEAPGKHFVKAGEFRGDLQKMVKLGASYNSQEYEPQQLREPEITASVTDQNEEVIWCSSKSRTADCIPAAVYLTGDSFRWNLSPYLQENTARTVISSRYYFDTEDLILQEPDVFVYMIAERYLHELSVLPGYNTMALQMPE